MTERPASRPSLYSDAPDTIVHASGHGFETVQRPDRMFVRQQLSRAGQRKHDRLDALGERGWIVVSTRGGGMVRHPTHPGLFSVAAAALRERLADA